MPTRIPPPMSLFPGLERRANPDAGVRGWLALFFCGACAAALVRAWAVGTLGVATGTLIASGALNRIFPGIAGAFAIELVLFLLTVNGVRLMVRGDAKTPDFWATVLLASTPALVLFYACVAYSDSVVEGRAFGASFMDHLLERGALRGILVSLLWALYWMKSPRVRLTYGRNAFAPRSYDAGSNSSTELPSGSST